MNGIWLLASPGPTGALPAGRYVAPLAVGATSASHDAAILLWPVFWLLACAVLVAFAMAVVPPFRRTATQLQQRHPRICAAMLSTYFSLSSTYLLGVLTISDSDASVSMLFRGQTRLFIRDILLPYGHLNPLAAVCGVLWLGLQATSIWIMWALLARHHQPHGAAGTRAHWSLLFFSKRSWRWLFLLFTAVAFAVVLDLAFWFYPSEIRVERAAAADQASMRRLSEAQAGIGGGHAGRDQSHRLVTSWMRVALLARASAISAQRLDAAKRERNRRFSRLAYVGIALATIWLSLSARRIGALLRNFGSYRGSVPHP